MIEVTDNFLLDDEFYYLKKEIMDNPAFPWYWEDCVVYDENHNDNAFQFVHYFWGNADGPRSAWFDTLRPILNKIDPLSIVRIKANLLTRSHDQKLNWYHQDAPNCTTGIFYLNDGDGYTVFETGEKVESKANRFVKFDSNIMHTGCSNSLNSEKRRVLINLNWIDTPPAECFKDAHPPN